jgi:hypothetical protein
MLLTRLHTNKTVDVAGPAEERYYDERREFIIHNSRDVHNDFSENRGFPHQEEHTLVYNSPDGTLPWFANSRLLCALDAICCGWYQRFALTAKSYEVEYYMEKVIVE